MAWSSGRLIIGGVVPVVNIPGIKPGDLVLDGPTLASIYMGEISRWNDPAIKKLNPSLNLPKLDIAPVYRSDGSGTNFLFTNYLSQVSPTFAKKIGANASVQWPVGIGAKGNEGVANQTTQTSGAIGYVEYAYVKQTNMTYAKLHQSRRQVRGAGSQGIPGGGRQCRLGQGRGLLPDPDRPAGRRQLADHRCELHPDACRQQGRQHACRR